MSIPRDNPNKFIVPAVPLSQLNVGTFLSSLNSNVRTDILSHKRSSHLYWNSCRTETVSLNNMVMRLFLKNYIDNI